MPHPFLVTAALFGAGAAAIRLFRQEQERVREQLDRVRREEGMELLPRRRLERDPLTGIYRLPGEGGSP